MIFFTILKIIGLIILVLLGILLTLIMLVLFVPIRYEAGAEKGDNIRADAQVSWLLHLIRGTVVYDQTSEDARLHLQLKLAGRKLYDNQKQASGSEKPEKPEKAAKEAAPQHVPETETKETGPKHDISPEKAEVKQDQTTDDLRSEEKKTANKTGGKTESRKTEQSARQESPPHYQSRASGPGLSDRLDKLQIKLERLSRKKEKLVCLFENEKNRRWLDKTLFRLKQLLIYLLPCLKRLRLHFGFDDPSLTGRLLGYLSICYPLCEDRMILEPVFNGKAFDGDVRLAGKIRLYRFITFAVPAFLNPRFFKIFKKVRCIIKK